MPLIRNDLNEKILTPETSSSVMSPRRRNRVLLLVLYSGAIRASEASALRWIDDMQPRSGGSGQLNMTGKGAKNRSIIALKVWPGTSGNLSKGVGPDAPVLCTG
jgi:site-specific recombinase XerD